jgi:hypothetical protein
MLVKQFTNGCIYSYNRLKMTLIETCIYNKNKY